MAGDIKKGIGIITMDKQSRPCCKFCNRRNPALLDCGGSGTVSYCNKGCQHGDWKNHKSECGRKPAGRQGVESLARGKDNMEKEVQTIPHRTFTHIPDDIKEKCDFLDRQDAWKRAGKDVFSVLVRDDEPGWEGHSITLRLEKLCEHVENLGYAQFDFYFALKTVMEKRDASGRAREWHSSREREYDELLEVTKIVGLSEKDGKRALTVVGHWRKVPHSLA